MKKPRVLVTPIDVNACGQYRLIEPYSYLISQNGFDEIEYVMHDFNKYNALADYEHIELKDNFDAVIVQRVAHPALAGVIERFKQRGGKVILDLDDHFFAIHQSNVAWSIWKPGSPARKALMKTLDLADQVHLSTEELIYAYADCTSGDVLVFPNTLRMDKYSGQIAMRRMYPADKTVIMWAGSTTHMEDLKMIYPVLQEILAKNPQAIFALCGNKEFLDWLDAPAEQKYYIPPVDFKDYFLIPSYADIFLCPVKESTFNDCKSDLKILEAAVWGVPCVVSPVAAYRRFAEHRADNILLAKKNREREWVKNIQMLIDSQELRKQIGQSAYDTICMDFYDFRTAAKDRHKEIKRLFF